MDGGVNLTTLDVVIIGVYFVAVAGIGVLAARKIDTGDDLFLAGRSLGWGAIGFSLFASNISSTTLIGLSGSAYKTGLSVANYEWMAALVLAFMGVYVVPVYFRSRISTIPEYLERRFGETARRYVSGITIFLSIMVDTAGGLYAGALVLKTFFPSLDLTLTCVVLALVAGVYTAAGGLRAVVYTDVIQAIVLIIGSTVMAWLVWGRFDHSWTEATKDLPEGHLSLIRPIDDPALPWLGTVVGLPMLGFYYWVTNQYIVQRVLGAKSLDAARWGSNLGAMLKLLPLFIMVLPGAMALELFPDLSNADKVFPTLVAKVLPPGVTGLVLAGLVAAIMSSIDSTLNSASTLITLDFIKPRDPDISDEKVGKIGRITTAVLMIVAAVWAPFIAKLGGLFDYLQTAFSYIVPPLVVVFLGGFFTKYGRKTTALVTLGLGHAITATAFVLGPVLKIITLHFTIMAGLLTAICAVIFFAHGRLGGRRDDIDDSLVYSPALTRGLDSRGGLTDARVLAGGVVLVTIAIVAVFW